MIIFVLRNYERYVRKLNKKIMITVKACAAVSAAALMTVYPEVTANSAVNSINVCISAIIPSMFAFMVLTGYICDSGIYPVIFRPVFWIMRRIIKADDRMISVFLMSMIGGYPVGVKLLKETIAQNKNYPAIKGVCRDSAMFCYCISPTFALIMLGNGVFGSTAAGAVIYISDVLSCLITAAAVSRFCRLKTGIKTETGSGSLIGAVNSASRALFVVCTVIVAFNTALDCITAFLGNIGITLPKELLGALEVSNLLKIQRPGVSLIPVVTAISSMGGVCVLLQCAAIVKGEFPIKRFIIARLPCALLSGFISWVILKFTDISVETSTFSPQYTYDFSANKIIVLVLIAMCIIILHKSDKILKKV